MRRETVMIFFALLLALTPAAQALLPEERLADPAAEERARGLSAQLRCLVCQNQSIDDSDAPFARDMRKLIRQEINTARVMIRSSLSCASVMAIMSCSTRH